MTEEKKPSNLMSSTIMVLVMHLVPPAVAATAATIAITERIAAVEERTENFQRQIDQRLLDFSTDINIRLDELNRNWDLRRNEVNQRLDRLEDRLWVNVPPVHKE